MSSIKNLYPLKYQEYLDTVKKIISQINPKFSLERSNISLEALADLTREGKVQNSLEPKQARVLFMDYQDSCRNLHIYLGSLTIASKHLNSQKGAVLAIELTQQEVRKSRNYQLILAALKEGKHATIMIKERIGLDRLKEIYVPAQKRLEVKNLLKKHSYEDVEIKPLEEIATA